VRATGSATLTPQTKLVAAVLATCHVCQAPGPIARLSEHLREDHALGGQALRAALGKSTAHATVAA
jgi:hypothetical protein